MGHCKDCKWWIPDHDIQTIHSCGSPLVLKTTDFETDIVSGNGVLIYYSEAVDFYTGPDFGCVNFEAKENKT